jgi:DNA polymerase delta subunit 1
MRALYNKTSLNVSKKLTKYVRHYKPQGPIKDKEGYITFQSISWVDGDFPVDMGGVCEDNEENRDNGGEDDCGNECFDERPKYIPKEYQIIVTGICENSAKNERGREENEGREESEGEKKDHSITVRITGYRPSFYILVPDNWNIGHKNKVVEWLKKQCYNKGVLPELCKIIKKKKLYPYTGHKEYVFIKLVFDSMKCFNIAKSKFKVPISVPGVCTNYLFQKYESKVCLLNKFCHEKDITTTSFIKIQKFELDPNTSTTEYRLVVSEKDIFKAEDSTTSLNFRIMSYDIETQSHVPEDAGHFPDPNILGDYIGQIGISILFFKTKEILKILLSKGPCSPIDNCIVFSCETEEELLLTYLQIINMLDPDIITGYNIWNFDDKYVMTRIKLLGLEEYLCLFSRINLTLEDLGLVTAFKLKIDAERNGHGKNSSSSSSNIRNQSARKSDKSVKKVAIDYYARPDDPAGIIEYRLESSAYGKNMFYILTMPGRESIDLIENIKKEHKLENYKLDTVGEVFIGENKVGIHIQEMFKYMGSGDPDLMQKVGVYCIQDTNLVIKIIMKLLIIQNYIEMAKITFVPFTWLSTRGQQCKVFSLIVKNAKMDGFLVPDVLTDKELSEKDRNFDGALVLEPDTGSHFDPVMVMDYASLYPSIMRAFNACLSTIVDDTSFDIVASLNGQHPVQEAKKIEWPEKDDPKNPRPAGVEPRIAGSYTFMQHTDDPKTRGVVPKILDNLTKWRKETKRLMAESTDQNAKDVYNSKQLSIKIVMNSIYGFFGSRNAIAWTPIAASVTAMGREVLRGARKIAEESFRGNVLYGDSIPGYEKVWINDNHLSIKEHVHDILKQGHKWTNYKYFKHDDGHVSSSKQQIDFCDHNNVLIKNNFITETGSGKSPVRRIIRHKTSKKLYKVTCIDSEGNEYTIVVTEGHSLIGIDGKPIPANELSVGTVLP